MLCLCVQPIFLNEVMLRKSPDDDPDGTIFHVSHIEHLYSLRAPSTAERSVRLSVNLYWSSRLCLHVECSHFDDAVNVD